MSLSIVFHLLTKLFSIGLKESGVFFYYVNDEFLTYWNIYQFILCKCAGWGKLSEKTFKEKQNNYTFEYHRFDWLSAPHTHNTIIQTLHSITLYKFN